MKTRRDARKQSTSKTRPSPSRSRDKSQPRTGTQRDSGLREGDIASLPVGDHADRDGLVLRVSSSGRRTWHLRYRAKVGRHRGAQHRLLLGRYRSRLEVHLAPLGLGDLHVPDELDLRAARDVAAALQGKAALGIDLLAVLRAEEERQEREEREAVQKKALGSDTVLGLVQRYVKERAEEVSANTRRGWAGAVKEIALAPFADMDPRELRRPDAKAWHKSIGSTGRRVWANRVLELLRSVYSWGVEEELITSSPLIRLKIAFKEQPRQRVLSHEELRAVWAALDAEPYGDAFRLALWTGCRLGEIIGVTWAELDLRGRAWRLPPERTKTGVARTVPLSSDAVAMLQARKGGDPRWTFPSPVGACGPVVSLQAPHRRIMERSGVASWTFHDLRRTVRTGLASIGIAPHIAEAILGHARPRIERVYNVYEPVAEMASALESWARRLREIVTGQEQAPSVVPFVKP